MQRRLVLVVTLAILIKTRAAGLDWKSQLASTAVGQAARAGIEDAVGGAVKDAAFDAALEAVPVRKPQAVQRVVPTASAGIESAMTAANVASSLDTALNAAEAAQKANKARKAIRKVR
jgi:hypothetical protein